MDNRLYNKFISLKSVIYKYYEFVKKRLYNIYIFIKKFLTDKFNNKDILDNYSDIAAKDKDIFPPNKPEDSDYKKTTCNSDEKVQSTSTVIQENIRVSRLNNLQQKIYTDLTAKKVKNITNISNTRYEFYSNLENNIEKETQSTIENNYLFIKSFIEKSEEKVKSLYNSNYKNVELFNKVSEALYIFYKEINYKIKIVDDFIKLIMKYINYFANHQSKYEIINKDTYNKLKELFDKLLETKIALIKHYQGFFYKIFFESFKKILSDINIDLSKKVELFFNNTKKYNDLIIVSNFIVSEFKNYKNLIIPIFNWITNNNNEFNKLYNFQTVKYLENNNATYLSEIFIKICESIMEFINNYVQKYNEQITKLFNNLLIELDEYITNLNNRFIDLKDYVMKLEKYNAKCELYFVDIKNNDQKLTNILQNVKIETNSTFKNIIIDTYNNYTTNIKNTINNLLQNKSKDIAIVKLSNIEDYKKMKSKIRNKFDAIITEIFENLIKEYINCIKTLEILNDTSKTSIINKIKDILNQTVDFILYKNWFFITTYTNIYSVKLPLLKKSAYNLLSVSLLTLDKHFKDKIENEISKMKLKSLKDIDSFKTVKFLKDNYNKLLKTTLNSHYNGEVEIKNLFYKNILDKETKINIDRSYSKRFLDIFENELLLIIKYLIINIKTHTISDFLYFRKTYLTDVLSVISYNDSYKLRDIIVQKVLTYELQDIIKFFIISNVITKHNNFDFSNILSMFFDKFINGNIEYFIKILENIDEDNIRKQLKSIIKQKMFDIYYDDQTEYIVIFNEKEIQDFIIQHRRQVLKNLVEKNSNVSEVISFIKNSYDNNLVNRLYIIDKLNYYENKNKTKVLRFLLTNCLTNQYNWLLKNKSQLKFMPYDDVILKHNFNSYSFEKIKIVYKLLKNLKLIENKKDIRKHIGIKYFLFFLVKDKSK